MFVIVKVYRLEKGLKELYKERFSQPFVLQNVDGFVRREVLFDQKNPMFDTLRISVYFESRDAYIAWEGSELHRSMHANGKKHPEMPGVIEGFKESYHELVTLSHH